MRIERLVPCPPKELWRALIQHAELGERGPSLRLALPGGLSETVERVTVYQSPRLLECSWGGSVLRWELESRDGNDAPRVHACAGRRALDRLPRPHHCPGRAVSEVVNVRCIVDDVETARR